MSIKSTLLKCAGIAIVFLASLNAYDKHIKVRNGLIQESEIISSYVPPRGADWPYFYSEELYCQF